MDDELQANEIKIGEDIKVVDEDVATYVKSLEDKIAADAENFEAAALAAGEKLVEDGSILAERVRKTILDIRNEIKHSFMHQAFLDDILRRLNIL